MRRWLKVWMVALMATAAMGQTPQAPAAAQAQVPAASAPKAERQLQALKKLYDDFGGLQRYAQADAALPATEPGRVVFYGDSITDAWTRNGGKFFPGKPYLNRGISGQTTPQMLVRFRQDVIDLHPEAVVILAGTNDIAGNTGPETPEMIEGNFRSMTELAKANGIRVILASILPTTRYPWRPEVPNPAPEIRELNAWIASYCKEQKITYLDYYDSMAGPDGGMKPGISIDGVHPNAAGYAIMEPLAEKALSE
jgi:lysophospholipase L1-like esterase